MCRLLGVVTSEPHTLPEVLGDQLDGYTELSHEHQHGWGIAARRPDDTVDLTKGAEPAWTSPLYAETLRTTISDQTIVHIRKASPDMPVVLKNCHPFVRTVPEGAGLASGQQIAFEHNGFFEPSPRLRGWLRDHDGPQPEGDTDSELYFCLLLVHARTRDWPAAIEATVRQIVADYELREPGDRPDSLNCLVSTPDAIYAYSQHEPRKLRPTAARDYYVLRLAQRPDATIVASTLFPLDGAEPVEQQRVFRIDRENLSVRFFDPIEF
jgi:predicted glutamine amidotransferase